jgi:hypothetical protein
MPIIKLGGRLGNELFQIAWGISVSHRTGSPLLVDWGDLTRHQKTQLEAWTGPLIEASPGQIRRQKGPSSLLGKVHRMAQGLRPARSRRWFLQDSSAFDHRLEESRGDAYYDGYWQSHRYFQSCESHLRTLVRYRSEILPRDQRWVSLCSSPDTVSIHVRRGDYGGISGFETQSVGYFQRGYQVLSQKVSVGVAVVFSDDLAWCRENLDLPGEVVYCEGNSPEFDLYLMSLCSHHIVGTSTFSWWGAYLGAHQGSVTIAPKQWFASYGSTPPLGDIYPPHWVLIAP